MVNQLDSNPADKTAYPSGTQENARISRVEFFRGYLTDHKEINHNRWFESVFAETSTWGDVWSHSANYYGITVTKKTIQIRCN